jgi:hypothetical protein
MERNYDEVISDMLIQLAGIERSLEQENRRMEAFDKRMELTIRRMVKAETRLESAERRSESAERRMEFAEKRMELFDQKLEKSILDQKEFSKMQSQMNKYFIDFLNKNGKS